MNPHDLQRRVRNLETLVGEGNLSSTQRDALRQEAGDLRRDLEPETMMGRWAFGGAAAGAVLPILGVVSGAVGGAAYALYRAQSDEIAGLRDRLDRVLEEVAFGR